MNIQEWINLGMKNGLVDFNAIEELKFEEVYQKWFLMKLKTIKLQSCDRIECCYNKYYRNSSFASLYVSVIDESSISAFLTRVIIGEGGVSRKEYRRIYQIVNNVLIYAKDLGLGGARLIDWDIVKRYVPNGKCTAGVNYQFAVPKQDVEKLMDMVVNNKVYYLKQSACLCLMLNFYLGLRIGELASLTWQDINYTSNVVRVCKTEIKTYERDEQGRKSGSMVYRVVEDTKTLFSIREVPLLPEAVYLLQELKAHHEVCGYTSPYLAYDGTDCILVRSLDRTLRRLCSLCGINRFNTHAIRKTFATMLHMSGMPIRYISDLLGHSEILTTERNYILAYEDNTEELLQYMSRGLSFRL